MPASAHKWLASLALLVSCTETLVVPAAEEQLQVYFPVAEEQVWEFSLFEVLYELDTEPDTTWYDVRYTFGEVEPDQQGNPRVDVVTESRPTGTAMWQTDSVYSYTFRPTGLVQRRSNRDYVLLPASLEKGAQWDGNGINELPQDVYTLERLDEPVQPNDTVRYERVAQVIQEDLADPLVVEDIRNQVFAQDVGLVYEEQVRINYCTRSDCFGEGIIDFGYRRYLVRK